MQLTQTRPAGLRMLASCLGGWCVEGGWNTGTEVSGERKDDRQLEVHGAVGQVVLAANVADLLCLHGLEFGAVSDPMTQASTEGTATLSWGHGERGSAWLQGQGPHSRLWSSLRSLRPLMCSVDLLSGIPIMPHSGLVSPTLQSPPMSSMDSSPQCSTCSTGGTFCLASSSRALRSISTDSSVGQWGTIRPNSEPSNQDLEDPGDS